MRPLPLEMISLAALSDAASRPDAMRGRESAPSTAPRENSPAHGLEFEVVYSEQFAFIWRAVRGFGVPASQVDDVTQDVFLIVHRKLASLESALALRSWLFGITRRVCKDHRRAVGRRGLQLELDEQRDVDAADDPQQRASTRQALNVVERYADGLDEEHRAILFLALVEGLPIAEVSEILGLNANTTYSRVRVFRRELSELLSAETAGERGAYGGA